MEHPKFKLNYETLITILNSAHDEIYVVNAEGIVVYVNKACEKHYGVKAEDIIGKNSEEISQLEYWTPRISPIAFKRKRSITLEQKTHTGRTLLTTATPIFDDKGNIEFIIENSRDISENVGINNELEKSRQLLKRYKQEVEILRKKELTLPNLYSTNKKMEHVMEVADRIATVDSVVLLLGESGTGKSLLAKHIHNSSNRHNGPFITVNCAAIPHDLMESELFGYSRGAFTGASDKGKVGLIELASEGTLFLDEIGELPFNMQAKLLQFLQDNQYFKVGGREIKKGNCRIITATNRNLSKMIVKGKFREDLYYRLNVFEMELPPLRERKEEISDLTKYFLDKFNRKYKQKHEISNKCLELFMHYHWPGNIRELENIIERLVVVTKNTTIDICDLPNPFHTVAPALVTPAPENGSTKPIKSITFDEAICDYEKEIIQKAYKELGSSYEVAKALKISQSKANRLIRKYYSDSQKQLTN